MGRIDTIFTEARADDRGVLMPFIVGGFPSIDVTEMVLAGIDGTGARVVEIGIPFSDPIADGPIIASAMHDTLVAGTRIEAILDTVARARPHTEAALIAMVSHSIVHRLGDDAFVRRLHASGFDGLIVPDLDPGVADGLLHVIDELDMAMAMLVAPTTSHDRLPTLLACCRGLVYLLARTGLTGADADLAGLPDRVSAIRAHTDLPIAAGFGISTPEHVQSATACCDAAIVGSGIVRRMRESDTPAEDALSAIESLATGLRGH